MLVRVKAGYRVNMRQQLTSRELPSFAWGAGLLLEGVRWAVQLGGAHVEEQSFLEVVHHSQAVAVSKHNPETPEQLGIRCCFPPYAKLISAGTTCCLYAHTFSTKTATGQAEPPVRTCVVIIPSVWALDTYRPYEELIARLVICWGGSPLTHTSWITSSTW